MTTIEQMAEAALACDALRLRSLRQDLVREWPNLVDIARPTTEDATLLAIAAALIEIIALHADQPAPEWAAAVGPAPEPTYLVRSARTMRHLRTLCETNSPPPLNKRRLFAPPNFMSAA